MIKFAFKNKSLITVETKRTISFHVDLKALGKSTCLALITTRNVHDATSVLLTNVIEVSAQSNRISLELDYNLSSINIDL